MDYPKLFNEAKNASKNSYSPYSKFKVGAVILTKDGNYIKGTNIENASYSATMCAERAAVYNAICQGYGKNDMIAIAIYAEQGTFTYPCGSCRQVLSELCNKDMPVIMFNILGKKMESTVGDLLPLMFSMEKKI